MRYQAQQVQDQFYPQDPPYYVVYDNVTQAAVQSVVTRVHLAFALQSQAVVAASRMNYQAR